MGSAVNSIHCVILMKVPKLSKFTFFHWKWRCQHLF